jgi:uncharacterized membrane protein
MTRSLQSQIAALIASATTTIALLGGVAVLFEAPTQGSQVAAAATTGRV